MDQPEAIALCEGIFAKHLSGNALMSNATHLPGPQAWLNFRGSSPVAGYDKVVLLGDAAHTAHFSIGSGTKLALEDAIKLAEVLNRPGQTAPPRSRNIRPSATGRGAQAAERGAQLDRMVRDARPLPAASRRSSSPIRC
jgi:2-polyprenyl-6-methoxyphenol hydroxylase-like FAD-dependent oxidoreductase